MAQTTLTFLGFSNETIFMKPATSAAPHLSRDIPAIIPKKNIREVDKMKIIKVIKDSDEITSSFDVSTTSVISNTFTDKHDCLLDVTL